MIFPFDETKHDNRYTFRCYFPTKRISESVAYNESNCNSLQCHTSLRCGHINSLFSRWNHLHSFAGTFVVKWTFLTFTEPMLQTQPQQKEPDSLNVLHDHKFSSVTFKVLNIWSEKNYFFGRPGIVLHNLLSQNSLYRHLFAFLAVVADA